MTKKYRVTLSLESPLHIGNGDKVVHFLDKMDINKPFEENKKQIECLFKTNKNQDKKQFVEKFMRKIVVNADSVNNECAYIPASTLKGFFMNIFYFFYTQENHDSSNKKDFALQYGNIFRVFESDVTYTFEEKQYIDGFPLKKLQRAKVFTNEVGFNECEVIPENVTVAFNVEFKIYDSASEQKYWQLICYFKQAFESKEHKNFFEQTVKNKYKASIADLKNQKNKKKNTSEIIKKFENLIETSEKQLYRLGKYTDCYAKMSEISTNNKTRHSQNDLKKAYSMLQLGKEKKFAGLVKISLGESNE